MIQKKIMANKYPELIISNKLKEYYEKHNNENSSITNGDEFYVIGLYGATLLQAK